MVGTVLALASAPAIAADEICARLTAFHAAQYDQSVQPAGRRWVEVHWRGHWMDFDKGFGKECRSSPDSASKQFCSWLTQNSSTEFPTYLPIRMLGCLGYRFPTGAGNEWSGWKSDVSTLSKDRWLLLEVDLLTFKNDAGAIRLSSFAADKDQWTVEMPPLSELAR